MNDLALTPAASAASAAVAIRAEVRTLTVTGPDLQSLLSAVSADIEIAPTMLIDSDEMAEELQTMLGRLSTVAAAIEAERKERTKPLSEVADWLMNGYRPAKQAVDAVISEGKQKLTGWLNAKREAQRIAEAAAAAERRAAAEAAAKIEAEAVAAANKAAAEAAAARAAGSEQVADAMETQAMVAVDTARQNAAAAVQAMYVAPVRTAAPAVKGASVAWKGECTDLAALIVHVGKMIEAGDRSLVSLLMADARAINAIAKLQQHNLRIPGVVAQSEQRLAVRKQAVEA